jgi:hypothetical protein
MITNQISILTEEHLDDAVELVIDELMDICDPSQADKIYIELAAEQVGVMVTPQLVSTIMSRLEY